MVNKQQFNQSKDAFPSQHTHQFYLNLNQLLQ